MPAKSCSYSSHWYIVLEQKVMKGLGSLVHLQPCRSWRNETYLPTQSCTLLDCAVKTRTRTMVQQENPSAEILHWVYPHVHAYSWRLFLPLRRRRGWRDPTHLSRIGTNMDPLIYWWKATHVDLWVKNLTKWRLAIAWNFIRCDNNECAVFFLHVMLLVLLCILTNTTLSYTSHF